ncbi:MAG: hypothetical protein HQM03_14840 [Magnetococcales bacterium]|nr:hypothetical protein [Magnetococcales bacterium]
MSKNARTGERGAALLIVMGIIMAAGIGMALEALLIKSKRVRQDQKAGYALVEAKRALLAYAAMDAGVRTQFGNLPCPFTGQLQDYSTGAVESAPCGANDGFMQIGFFPWRTLRLPPLVDGDNAPLWYAVAGAFKPGSGQAMPYICNAVGNLTINGAGNYAAILFAPGEPLLLLDATTQTRTATALAAALRDQFLEERNATASTTLPPPIDFQTTRIMTSTAGGAAAPPFNDRLLGITCEEIIRTVNRLPP